MKTVKLQATNGKLSPSNLNYREETDKVFTYSGKPNYNFVPRTFKRPVARREKGIPLHRQPLKRPGNEFDQTAWTFFSAILNPEICVFNC